MRAYQITLFKRLSGTGEVYGAKSFTGNLDRACKRLIKKFGAHARVRVLGPGHYDIERGEAELRVVR